MPEPEEGTEVPDDRVRCPHCKTTRLKVLKKIDRIEKLYGNALMNRFRARRGDTIYHCVFCRLQFYDPRKPGAAREPQPDRRPETPAAPEKTEPEPEAIAPVPFDPPVTPVNGDAAILSSTNTNIASRVSIRGSVESAEDIYVEGRIDGKLLLQEHHLTIGRGGTVKATIHAAEIEVRGALHGNSHVTGRMILRTACQVTGDIKAADIVIEDGAQFKGSVELVRTQPRLPLG